MDKRRGLFIIIVLVLILGVVDAAWIISYRKTITANIIGEQKIYTISQEFSNNISLNTSTGPAEIITLMKIDGLIEDANMSFEIDTRRTNLTSKTECPNPDEDCGIIVTYIYNNGTGNVTNILSYKPANLGDDKNFTMYKEVENFLEYKIQCVEDSCPQRIRSNITLEQIPNSF
jgi:hypothetical protein